MYVLSNNPLQGVPEPSLHPIHSHDSKRSPPEGRAAGRANPCSTTFLPLPLLLLWPWQLAKVFRSQGLEKYGEVADKFDPHLHDAMFEFEDPAQEPGTLGQVGTRKRNGGSFVDGCRTAPPRKDFLLSAWRGRLAFSCQKKARSTRDVENMAAVVWQVW